MMLSCDNNYTIWMFNYLLVVVLLIQLQYVEYVTPTAAVTEHVSVTELLRRTGSSGSNSHISPLQHSWDRKNVGGVGVVGDEVDFSAYVNDFNMQDETSIPEDILDQQHIGDADDIIDATADSSSSNIQYAEESEAADIILESQRSSSTSKNFTSYDVKANKSSSSRRNSSNNKNNNGNGSGSNSNSNSREKKNKNNANKNHYNKFKNNKNIDDVDEENEHDADNYNQDEHENVDTFADADNVDDMKDVMSTEFMSSISNKKFKDSVHSQEKTKQQEKQQQLYQQQQRQQPQQQQQQKQHQQQMETIVKLNERKFNKVSLEKNSKDDDGKDENINDENTSGSSSYNKNNNNNKNNKYNSINPKNNFDDDDDDDDDDGDADGGIKLDESAIGDIEDNFRNDDETFADAATGAIAVVDIDVDDNGNGEQPVEDSAIDKDKSVATATEGHHQATKIENANTKVSTNFIGRKMKRNHDAATTRIQYNDDLKNRAKFRRHHYNKNNDDNDDADDKKENNNNKDNEQQATKSSTELLQQQQQQQENNIKQTDDYRRRVYFGTLANVSNTSEDTRNYSNEAQLERIQQQQLQEHSAGKTNHIDAASAAVQFGDENFGNVNKQYASVGAEDVEAVIVEAGEGNEAITKSQTQSAFEQYKAQRRNSRRYGHKNHKKKYKDYLRYIEGWASAKTIVTSTTPATIRIPITTATSVENVMDATIAINATRQITNNTTDNYQQQKVQEAGNREHEEEEEEENLKRAEKLRQYARKIEAEKSSQYGLPASPIFVVTNRNRNVAGGAAAKSNAGDNVQNAEDEHHHHHRSGITSELPFYEGHINYFLETKDDNEEQHSSSRDVDRRQHNHNMNSMLATENNNWYRRVSPVLRNGIKTATNGESKQQQQKHSEAAGHEHESRRNHHQHHHVQHTATHHHHQHLQHQQQEPQQHQHHRNHHKHHHHNKQHSQQQRSSYQRKMLPGAATAATKHSPSSSSSSFSALHPWKTVLTENQVHTSHSTAPSFEEHQLTPLPPPAYKQHQPHAGAMEELGHQITDMKEFERYYAKWPHLARVESQVYNEHYRDTYPDLYTEYSDYESAAELEEAENANDEEANLPPYIKKYNRRNKQLLDLLEGTLAPPTRPPQFRGAGGGWSSSLLQPGPHDSSSRSSSSGNIAASTRMAGGGGGGAGGGGNIDTTAVRIDDDYLKEKRRRYHRNHGNNNSNNSNRHYQDLFAQQRASSTESPGMQNDSNQQKSTSTPPTQHHPGNQLPDENLSISLEELEEEQARDDNDDIWQKEIENKSNANEMTGSEKMTWQIEKLAGTPSTALALGSATSSSPSMSPSPLRPATPKAAIFKLPSYPAIAGSFMSKPRSRSAQFAPSSGSSIRRGGSIAFLNAAGGYSGVGAATGAGVSGNNNIYYKSMPRFTAYETEKSRARAAISASALAAGIETSTPYPLPYDVDNAAAVADITTSSTPTTKAINSFVYHRVIDASPRLVGAGLAGRKQRLPFVAITDRRLETSKKTLLERQKDFEQNHFPMP